MGCAFGAEQKKSRNAALFLCAETLIAVWKYGGGRLPHNLHPNPQPSAKRDILPGKRTAGTQTPADLRNGRTIL